MNAREQRLALAFIALLIGGGAALAFTQMGKWKKDLERRENQLSLKKVEAEELLKQQAFWKTRSEWLTAQQPVWSGRKGADDELNKLISDSAKKAGVTLLGTQQENPEELNGMTAAGLVVAEAKGPMEKILRWLSNLQMPEGHQNCDAFISIKGLTMKPDQEDTAIVHVSDFHVQKWYRNTANPSVSADK